MKQLLITLLMLISVQNQHCYSQTYGWINIGSHLPNTISTATLSGIAMSGDSMWITSGYGTYQNQVPGEIYMSTDRGRTFTIQSTLYGTHTIWMQDAKRGWCGGVEGQIYNTADGGTTWERKFSTSRPVMSICFPAGSDTGYCTGFTGLFRMITPGSLLSINMQGYVSNIYSVSCPDKEHAFISGEELIIPYIRGNLNINQSYPGTNGIYAINMVDSITGWCVGSPTAAGAWDSAGCMIIKTTDGMNWVEQENPVKGKNGTLMAVKAVSHEEAWTVGTSGVILHTLNGGTTWVREAEGMTDEMLTAVWVAGPHEVYVLGNNRTLLKYGLLNDIEEPLSSNFDFKIYPNPAKDQVTLSTDFLPGSGDIKIKICDPAGRLIFTQSNPPASQINLMTEKFRSGVYWVDYETQNGHAIKKLIIL